MQWRHGMCMTSLSLTRRKRFVIFLEESNQNNALRRNIKQFRFILTQILCTSCTESINSIVNYLNEALSKQHFQYP